MLRPMQMLVHREEWPLARPFKISRSTMTMAYPVVVELRDGEAVGRGECEAHESDLDVIAAAILEALKPLAADGRLSRQSLRELLPACPIRNAVDCALWDLEAKKSGRPVWQLAGIGGPRPLLTVYTISVDEPAVMAEQAAEVAQLPMLKVKLKGDGDLERLEAVRKVAPRPRLIVDANEAWTFEQLREFAPRCASLGVELIEQPLPRGRDSALAGYRSPVPLCADETCHDVATLPDVIGKYQYINIKLDKTGGLTEAVDLYRAAAARGLEIMVGCMVGTSLAMAPAALIGAHARYVDLDGPLLLARDREPGLVFLNGVLSPPTPQVWG
jgi:L-alanine-DL-glutamate epimerase-like enolase superfamily enzyme